MDCGRQNNGPPKTSQSQSLEPVAMLYYMARLHTELKLRIILRWGGCPGLSGQCNHITNVITRVLKVKEGGRRVSARGMQHEKASSRHRWH